MAQPAGKEPTKQPSDNAPKRKRKLIIALLVVVLGVGGPGYKTMPEKPAFLQRSQRP